jgi:hypothetical protein
VLAGRHKYGSITTAVQKLNWKLFFVANLKMHLRPEVIAIILPRLASSRWVPEKQDNEFRRKRFHAPAGEENHA